MLLIVYAFTYETRSLPDSINFYFPFFEKLSLSKKI